MAASAHDPSVGGMLCISFDELDLSDLSDGLHPPPLRHQAASEIMTPDDDVALEEDDLSPPRFRSIHLPPLDTFAPVDTVCEDEEFVYRSALPPLGVAQSVLDEAAWAPDPCSHQIGGEKDTQRSELCATVQPGSTRAFLFELPGDLFDAVLTLLAPSPGLFAAMAVSTSWRDAARANYQRRVVVVPASADSVLRAAARAQAGDTLRLAPGIHLLSSELTIDRPLRVLSENEAERALGSCAGAHAASTAESASAPSTAAFAASTSLGGAQAATAASASTADSASTAALQTGGGHEASAVGGGGAVLVATLHVLLRTRCTAFVAGITLCRMGDEVGFPNAVTYAEAGLLRMERCRVTCGGAATSVPQALQAFAGVPEPGSVGCTGCESESAASRSASVPTSRDRIEGAHHPEASPPLVAAGLPVGAHPQDERMQCPQSGVWVGAAACVELRGCTIASCMGPGVKIYRGRLFAHCNTIAFSSRGANVVANGGHVVLERNEIRGANGDGISSWNNSVMRIERNSIHANSGAGIAVNGLALSAHDHRLAHGSAGAVTVANNSVFGNACQAPGVPRSAFEAARRTSRSR